MNSLYRERLSRPNQDWPKGSRKLPGQQFMYDRTKCPERLATISISQVPHSQGLCSDRRGEERPWLRGCNDFQKTQLCRNMLAK